MRAMTRPYKNTREFVPLQIALVSDSSISESGGSNSRLGRMVHTLNGHNVHLIRPRHHKRDVVNIGENFLETLVAGVPVPGFPGLKTGLPAKGMFLRLWERQRPDIVHITTECLLGWSALSAARELHIPVSTDVHSKFHQHTRQYDLLKVPMAAYLRHFHNKAACTLVPTAELQQQLKHEGYRNVRIASLGLDTEVFHPARRKVHTTSG